MDNINMEEYISQFPEELQEEARKCATPQELLDFAGKHKLPLPDEALDAVAGGCGAAAPVDDHKTVEMYIKSPLYYMEIIPNERYSHKALGEITCTKCHKKVSFALYAVVEAGCFFGGVYDSCEIHYNEGIPINTAKILELSNTLVKEDGPKVIINL